MVPVCGHPLAVLVGESNHASLWDRIIVSLKPSHRPVLLDHKICDIAQDWTPSPFVPVLAGDEVHGVDEPQVMKIVICRRVGEIWPPHDDWPDRVEVRVGGQQEHELAHLVIACVPNAIDAQKDAHRAPSSRRERLATRKVAYRRLCRRRDAQPEDSATNR